MKNNKSKLDKAIHKNLMKLNRWDRWRVSQGLSTEKDIFFDEKEPILDKFERLKECRLRKVKDGTKVLIDYSPTHRIAWDFIDLSYEINVCECLAGPRGPLP